MSNIQEIVKYLMSEVSKENLEKLRSDWEVNESDYCITGEMECNDTSNKDKFIIRLAMTEDYYFEFNRKEKTYLSPSTEGYEPVYPLYRIDQLINLLESKGYFVKIETLSRIGFRVNLIKRENNILETDKDLWKCLYKLFIRTYEDHSVKEVNSFQ